jgi:Zn-dependent protease
MARAEWSISVSFLGLMLLFVGLALAMQQMGDSQALVFPFVLTGYLISLCLHEYGHALAAYAGGDYGVEHQGYLTLDPLRYLDLQFSIILPLMFLMIGGIGLPGAAVYLNMAAIRSPFYRSLASGAGPLATLGVLLFLLVVLESAGASMSAGLYMSLAFLAFLTLSGLVLNLLPVPGLDGWGIIGPWLPAEAQEMGARLAPIGPLLLFTVFILVPAANNYFWGHVYRLSAFIGLDPMAVGYGWGAFQFWR